VTRGATSVILVDQVVDWLNRTALGGTDLEALVRGCIDRLAATGMPVARIQITFAMLHPLYRAMGFTWRRAEGLKIEAYRHGPQGEADRFLRSPYFHLLHHQLDHMRRRLVVGEPSEFPIFEDLKKEGLTDYLAFRTSFEAEHTQGMMGSWSTDSQEGFDETDIASLLRIQNNLAVAAKMAVLNQLAANMLTTYLGGDAGKRVLSGQIKRGEGETIRAALIMADMRQSTAIAERLGRQEYIDTLNQFFDAIAAPYTEAGAEILSYVGDGFLAVFPCERHRKESELACRAALAGTRSALARMAALNLRRQGESHDPIGFGIGLHIGNVMFGNVGLKDRLTFSVFGAVVNEVQRLEQMTKTYESNVVASEDFVDYCGGEWTLLGREKLRGTGRDLAVYTPPSVAIDEEEATDLLDQLDSYLSDAEQVVLLHRDARKVPQPAVAS
jgi:adenylate cyclase